MRLFDLIKIDSFLTIMNNNNKKSNLMLPSNTEKKNLIEAMKKLT